MINVEALILNNDLVEIVRKAGGDLDSHNRCACPLHGGDNDTAFSVYVKDGKQLWHCWTGSCGSGDVISFVEKWKGLDFKRACEYLGVDIQSDPEEVLRLTIARAERAKERLEIEIAEAEKSRESLREAKKHIWYHEHMKDWARQMWLARGIDESWQGFWTLGACEDRIIRYKDTEHHTPTLTIPIVGKDYELLNIKHRLLNPIKPKDKYRPEREGLGPFPPFIAFPDVMWDAPVIWIVEGEIKAMVTATITPDSSWQFVGVPGVDSFDKLPIDLFAGKQVVVVPDPGEESELKAYKFAKKIQARFVRMPEKIDDLINECQYGCDWLASVYKQSRKVTK